MEIAIFEPLSTGDETLFAVIAFCAVVCLGVGIWGVKAKKSLAWMLGFMGFVIFGGNAAFMKFSESYITPIVIYEDKVDTPNGIFSYEEIIGAKIQGEGVGVRKRALSNESPEKVLILERKDGKGIMLAESQYPIREIKVALDKQMEIYYKK